MYASIVTYDDRNRKQKNLWALVYIFVHTVEAAIQLFHYVEFKMTQR